MNVTVTAGRVDVPRPPLGPVDSAPANALQIVAVAAGPVAWTSQLVANYVIAANACFYHGAARLTAQPGWENERIWVLVINIAAIVITLAAVAFGLRAIAWARAQSMSEERHTRVIGRTHAMGVAAVLFGIAFFIATVFTLIAILGTPQCPV